MTQHQPPPLPPTGGYSPQYGGFMPYYSMHPDALLAPAKRASWLLITLGVLSILAGLAGVLMVRALDDAGFEQMLSQLRQANPEQAQQLTVPILRAAMQVMMAMIGTGGIIALILAAAVRSGGRVASIIALLLTAVTTLMLLLMMLSSLGGGAQALVGSLIVVGIPLLLLAAIIISLLQAIRNAPHVEQARQQLHYAQHQQMAHYQQAYAHQAQWQQQPQQQPPADAPPPPQA